MQLLKYAGMYTFCCPNASYCKLGNKSRAERNQRGAIFIHPWKYIFQIMGTFFFGPAVTTFVRVANRLFPGTTLKAAAKKIALDQTVMAVPMISMFYLGMNVLEGNSFQTFKEEWKVG